MSAPDHDAAKVWAEDYLAHEGWTKSRNEAAAYLASQATLARARDTSQLDAAPCPLCTYRDGVFVKNCTPHAELAASQAECDSIREERDRLREALAVIVKVMGPFADGKDWGISMDAVVCLVARHALGMPDPLPDGETWDYLKAEARALLANTDTPGDTE